MINFVIFEGLLNCLPFTQKPIQKQDSIFFIGSFMLSGLSCSLKQYDNTSQRRESFQLEMTTWLSLTSCFLVCLPLSIPSGYLAFRLKSLEHFIYIHGSLLYTFIRSFLRLFKLNFLGTIFNKHTAFVLLYNGNISNIYVFAFVFVE